MLGVGTLTFMLHKDLLDQTDRSHHKIFDGRTEASAVGSWDVFLASSQKCI